MFYDAPGCLVLVPFSAIVNVTRVFSAVDKRQGIEPRVRYTGSLTVDAPNWWPIVPEAFKKSYFGTLGGARLLIILLAVTAFLVFAHRASLAPANQARVSHLPRVAFFDEGKRNGGFPRLVMEAIVIATEEEPQPIFDGFFLTLKQQRKGTNFKDSFTKKERGFLIREIPCLDYYNYFVNY